MNHEEVNHSKFFAEMAEYQISAKEFFSTMLLDSLERNFGLTRVLISYFDTHGKFLSWTNKDGGVVDSENHPYRKFQANDVVRHMIYNDAIRDRLTYFNVEPRLYRSSDIINPVDYDHSAYVRFIEELFHAHYSVTLAFGMNAYIQVAFLKTREEGDFTEDEMETLKKIYVYVANSYKNFKKYEQARIVSNIQSEIIASGEKAYLVTDDFMHVMSYNELAEEYLEDILGPVVSEQLSTTRPCSWLPFLLGGDEEGTEEKHVQVRVIRDYIFKIYSYDQSYSNKIIDRYHWITISKKEEGKHDNLRAKEVLTPAECRVAELLYNGLTYRAIAAELVVSYHTVKKHVQNIYTKCGVNSRYELCKWLENRESSLCK